MTPVLGWYLFCLGLALGVTLLAMSAYLALSPPWLRWLLLASGALVASRYVVMAVLSVDPAPQAAWGLRWCWYGTSIGLPFASAVALDALVRHPAMSPKKLLRWFSPFLAGYVLAIFLGHLTVAADPLLGASLKLTGLGVWLLASVHAVFVAGFVWLGCQLFRKIPSKPIRLALAALMLAQGYWYLRPYLFSEMAALLAVWFALQTARQHTV